MSNRDLVGKALSVARGVRGYRKRSYQYADSLEICLIKENVWFTHQGPPHRFALALSPRKLCWFAVHENRLLKTECLQQPLRQLIRMMERLFDQATDLIDREVPHPNRRTNPHPYMAERIRKSHAIGKQKPLMSRC